MTCADNIAGIAKAALLCLLPADRVSPWQWAEKNVKLSAKTTAKPGLYDSSWMAYVRDWHDDFIDPDIAEITICAGGQMSKTESLLNMVRYAVAVDPGPLLWVMPAETIARSFSETRLQPSLEDCEPCAGKIPDNQDKFKLLEMHLANMNINLAGANSAAQLASRPVRYLFLDEIDKFPEASSKEAGAVDLARVRTTSFWNRKIVCTSTPTLEDGAVWGNYMKGDQRRFKVPCPHCGERITFELAGLTFGQCKTKDGEDEVWDMERVYCETTYTCQLCAEEISMAQKPAAIAGGIWEPTNHEAPDNLRSYHISSLYSPFLSWGEIAVQFLQSKDDYSAFQNFTNSVLALPWKEDAEEVQQDEINAMIAGYELCDGRSDMPDGVELVTMGSDVGADYLVYTVRGWGKGGESWLLDYGKVDDFAAMREVSDRWAPDLGMMDVGFRKPEVCDFCSGSEGVWVPSKGSATPVPSLVKRSSMTWQPGSTFRQRRIKFYLFSPDELKSQLYSYRMKGKAEPWRLPQDIKEDYIRQVTAERVVQGRDKRGRPVLHWKQSRHKPNHYGDCEVLQVVIYNLIARRLKKIIHRKEVADELRGEDAVTAERRRTRAKKRHRGKIRPLR